ncbi:MAG: class I SAM-dependent methyltransferase [Nanoarchaeota archaeon]|nr:class I SAM-dependent methyltransferase [Nanoarchaeota archaeon]
MMLKDGIFATMRKCTKIIAAYLKECLSGLFKKQVNFRDADNWILRRLFYYDMIRYQFASRFVGGKRVLNAACGYGDGCKELIKNCPKRIISVDINNGILSDAIKNVNLPNLEYIKVDVEKMPFNNKYFDVVVSIETIEHLSSPEKFLKEVKRVLIKHGTLVLSTPNKTIEKLFCNPPSHISLFKTDQIKSLLMKCFGNCQHYHQRHFIRKPIFLNYIHAAYVLLFGSGKVVVARKNYAALTNIFVVKNN